MTPATLRQWIEYPELLNRETLYELRTCVARYPYCQSLRLLFLKNLYVLHDADFGQELRKSALYITDRRVLFALIEGDKYTTLFKKTETDPETEEEGDLSELNRTLSLIDAFLSTIPEENLLPDGIDYSTDYTGYLLKTESAAGEIPPLHRQDLIDGFIEKIKTEPPVRPASGETDDAGFVPAPVFEENDYEEGYFTVTLAEIYIKQRRYSKALEIIKKLSLKYPKKNAYFADQIRFLEKLIINANLK